MANVAVTNTFTNATVADASQVNTNFTDLVNYINNRNTESATWDGCSIATAARVPLIVNNSTGTNNIATFQDNGTTKVQIIDGGNLLYPSISCRVYNSANIATTTGTATVITYDTERFDTDTLHSTVSNTGRLTATRAGKYFISTCVRWAANATGVRSLTIRLNGVTVIAQSTLPASGGTDITEMSLSCIYDMAATDYVETLTTQSSGGNLNVVAVGNISPEFGMFYIGD